MRNKNTIIKIKTIKISNKSILGSNKIKIYNNNSKKSLQKNFLFKLWRNPIKLFRINIKCRKYFKYIKIRN